MYDISVKTNLDQVTRKLSALAYDQLPFATAQALTQLARDVQAGERLAMQRQLDRPTPFTLRGVRIIPARKGQPWATVYVQDITARYLEPYERGGLNVLNGRALLKPIAQGLNQYGNIPKGTLARLTGGRAQASKLVQWAARGGVAPRPKGRRSRSVFVGDINGTRGVWKRVGRGLRLLIRFSDAHQATQRIHYRETAARIVAAGFNRRLGEALARAMATSR